MCFCLTRAHCFFLSHIPGLGDRSPPLRKLYRCRGSDGTLKSGHVTRLTTHFGVSCLHVVVA